jgi:hypothetical protein
LAVALDAQDQTGGNVGNGFQDTLGTSPVTLSYTGLTTVAPTLLLAVLILNGLNGTPTSVAIKWNSVSMTQLATNNDSPTSDNFLYLFGLLNPAAGNKTLTATWGAAADGILTAVSFKGTDTSSLSVAVPSANIITLSQNVSANTADPNSALTVTTANGDAAYACASSNPVGPFAGCSSGTWISGDSGAGNYNGWHGYRLATTSSTAIQFNAGTGTPGVTEHIAVRIQQPQAAGTTDTLGSTIYKVKHRIIY